MLARYGLSDTYIKHTPCTQSIYNQRLLDPVSPYAPIFEDNYTSQIGTLGCLRRTRPDLCVGLGVSQQFAKRGRHGPPHYRAVRNIMRYCKLTMHHGLVFQSSWKGFRQPWIIGAHVDSDWAAWKGSRRSRTGWLIYLQKHLICFGSKLQGAVALSSTEAEYMALSHVIRLLLWIMHMIESLPGQFVQRPVRVHEDNRPTINLANNHAASKFTRHIGIAHHFLRDHCTGENKQFEITWIDGKSQKADGMTKPKTRAEFITFRDSVVSDLQL